MRSSLGIAERSAGLALLLTLTLSAQSLPENPGPWPAGSRSLTFAGVPGGNAAVLTAVYYPATAAAQNAPFQSGAAPCPVVAFGHGFSLPANVYETLYQHLASHGYVVLAVSTEQGLFTGNLPRFIQDLRAAVLGFRAESLNPASPLAGAVAAGTRAVAMGHSFGGSAALVATASSPDLFAGVITLAATSTSPQGVDILAATATLQVPALHLGASQDTIVPPPQNLDPLYLATPTSRRLLEIAGGTHSYFHEAWYFDRLTEPAGSITVQEQQRLVRHYGLSFLTWVLRQDPRWLDVLLGPTALADPGLSRQQLALQEALLFARGPALLGAVFELHAARRPGDQAWIGLALGPANIPTPLGPILLDPASLFLFPPLTVGSSSLATLLFAVPPDPLLLNLALPTQALLVGPTGGDLSERWMVTFL